MKKQRAFLALIFFFYIVLVSFGLNFPLYNEESFNTNLDAYFNSRFYLDSPKEDYNRNSAQIEYHQENGMVHIRPHHPPFTISLFYLSTRVFGENNFSFRIIPALFGLLGIYVLYLIGNILSGRRAGLISAFLASFYYYYIVQSLQVDPHGAVHFTLFSLAIYFFLKYEQSIAKDKILNKYLFISSFFAGLALLNVLSAVLVFLIIGSYYFLKELDVVKTIKFSLFYSIFPSVMILITFLTFYVINFDIMFRAFFIAGGIFSSIPNPRIIGYLLILFGPFMLILSLLAIRMKNLLLILWAYLPILLFSFTSPIISIERYLAMAIPGFVLLVGIYISNKIDKFEKKELAGGLMIFLGFLVLIFSMNMNTDYVVNSMNVFFQKILQLNWNFYLPMTGSSGPVMGVSFLSVAVSLMISFGLFFFYVLFRLLNKEKISRFVFVLLIAVSLSFNSYLVIEYLFKPQHPDYMHAKEELTTLYKEKYEDRIVLGFDQSYFFYLDNGLDEFYDIYNRDFEVIKEVVANKKPIILVVDFPKKDKTSKYWELIETCNLVETIESRGEIAGYMFDCENEA